MIGLVRTRAHPLETRWILILAATTVALTVLTANLGQVPLSSRSDTRPSITAAGGEDGGDLPPLPPDILALGTVVKPLAPEGMIPLDQALVVAVFEFPFIEHGTIDGYLVALTDPEQLAGVGAQDRAIWIIRATGLSADIFSAPILPDGTAADVGLATRGYIYVDAVTGEWLQAHFE